MKDVEVKINEDALGSVLAEALESGIEGSDLSYPCPECGKPITISGTTNECSCGFILEVRVG